MKLLANTRALLWIAALATGCWALSAYIAYSMSLAIVAGGMTPGLAGIDAEAFDAAVHPTEVTPGISELKSSGKVLFLAEGTKVRELKAISNKSCQGAHYPANVKVLNGPWSGRKLWMCSDSFDTLYKWP